jgi:hypothetical protein
MRLIFSDTDSLHLEIETDDVYEDFNELREHFDFHKFPKEHWLYSMENMHIPGKFKDEAEGKIVVEEIALQSKHYAIRYWDPLTQTYSEQLKGSGVNQKALSQQSSVDKYRSVLNSSIAHFSNPNVPFQSQKVHFERIASVNHRVFNIETNRIAVSPDDYKRWLCDDGVDTYAYGHFRTRT